MPVYVPRELARDSTYCSAAAGNCPAQISTTGSYPRKYVIRDRHGHAYPAYQLTVEINPSRGQYYDIQGMTWQTPPILSGPRQVQVVDGKRLDLYFGGSKLELVAWHTPHGVYWVTNTLTNNLDEAQMTWVAASLARAGR
jgi:hypothetical protein